MKRGWKLAVLMALAAVLAAGAVAQDKKKEEKKREAQLRTVRGVVQDKDENPIPAGIVYLKNLKSQAVKTSFAEDDGTYRFSGLDPNVDYEIHAEHDDMASAKRTISSYDTRKEITINLKVNKKKDEK